MSDAADTINWRSGVQVPMSTGEFAHQRWHTVIVNGIPSEARRLITFVSLLHPDRLSFRILLKISGASNGASLKSFTDFLVEKSLIKYSQRKDIYYLGRPIQTAVCESELGISRWSEQKIRLSEDALAAFLNDWLVPLVDTVIDLFPVDEELRGLADFNITNDLLLHCQTLLALVNRLVPTLGPGSSKTRVPTDDVMKLHFRLSMKIGWALRAQQELDAAYVCFENSLSTSRSIGQEDGNNHNYSTPVCMSMEADALCNIGLVLYKHGLYSDALVKHEEALSIRQKVHGRNHALVALSLNNIGKVLLRQSAYTPALIRFEESLRIHKLVYVDNHPKVAASLNNIGTVHYKKGDFKLAQVCFEESLRIRRLTYGPDHSLVADSLTNLGNVHLDAAQALVQAEDPGQGSASETIPPHSIPHADTNTDLIRAMSLFQEALRVYRLVYGPQHTLVSTALNNIGLVQAERGEFSASLESHKEALAIDQENARNRNFAPGVHRGIVSESSSSSSSSLHAASADIDDDLSTQLSLYNIRQVYIRQIRDYQYKRSLEVMAHVFGPYSEKNKQLGAQFMLDFLNRQPMSDVNLDAARGLPVKQQGQNVKPNENQHGIRGHSDYHQHALVLHNGRLGALFAELFGTDNFSSASH